jgi:hypothetical protein
MCIVISLAYTYMMPVTGQRSISISPLPPFDITLICIQLETLCTYRPNWTRQTLFQELFSRLGLHERVYQAWASLNELIFENTPSPVIRNIQEMSHSKSQNTHEPSTHNR